MNLTCDKTLSLSVVLVTLLIISGCGKSDNIDRDGDLELHTGFVYLDQATNKNSKKESLRTGKTYYVFASRLRVRQEDSTTSTILGVLKMNDKVVVVNPHIGNGNSMVEIKIVKTNSKILDAPKYYTSHKYLAAHKRSAGAGQAQVSKYFMIQNIATEKLRVYEKGCDTSDCPNKLIFEADMAAGEYTKSGSTMTILGHFAITSWHKFYQDGKGLYPSWYDPSSPKLPKPGSSLLSWTSKDLLPGGRGSVRGAFGWYTAKVGPRSAFQWTHGTMGWGKDKDEFISATRGFFANLFSDPRSHGCSRVSNETIAYIRQLLPVGSTVLKVYAQEAQGSTAEAYSQNSGSWNYILTTNGVRQDGQKADRADVLEAQTPRSQWLEEGTYVYDRHPDLVRLTGEDVDKYGTNGNIYGVSKDQMRGVLLVDEGRLVGYSHPSGLKRGGLEDEPFPSFVEAPATTAYEIPEPTQEELCENRGLGSFGYDPCDDLDDF
ncbi:MAG: L,D-transpeptidase family protein [Bacteriovoracaceae bacterium]|nr:L,D-transpeptidase family protein [Bacteriovoracaceae bacterium]